MMQCVRRCSFICGAVLSILLLLCSCQAGAGQLILPDNIPSENTSQGKKELLAALNTIGIRRPETTQDSYIPGADSVAETIFLCIQKKSGNNAAAAIKLLSANEVTGFANCANVVLNRLSPSPDETYFVSYALLSALFSLMFFSPTPARKSVLPSASSAVRRSSWLCSFPDNIFQDKQKMTAAVSCSAAVIFSVHPIGQTILYSYNKGSCQRLSTEKRLLFVDLRGFTL